MLVHLQQPLPQQRPQLQVIALQWPCQQLTELPLQPLVDFVLPSVDFVLPSAANADAPAKVMTITNAIAITFLITYPLYQYSLRYIITP